LFNLGISIAVVYYFILMKMKLVIAMLVCLASCTVTDPVKEK